MAVHQNIVTSQDPAFQLFYYYLDYVFICSKKLVASGCQLCIVYTCGISLMFPSLPPSIPPSSPLPPIHPGIHSLRDRDTQARKSSHLLVSSPDACKSQG